MWLLQTDRTEEGEDGEGGGGAKEEGRGDCSLSETRIEEENPTKNGCAANEREESSYTLNCSLLVQINSGEKLD